MKDCIGNLAIIHNHSDAAGYTDDKSHPSSSDAPPTKPSTMSRSASLQHSPSRMDENKNRADSSGEATSPEQALANPYLQMVSLSRSSPKGECKQDQRSFCSPGDPGLLCSLLERAKALGKLPLRSATKDFDGLAFTRWA